MKARRSPLTVVGAVLLGSIATVAVLAPLIAPYDPEALAGPSLERPSAHHLLGTDDIGRDTFSALIWGARQSILVAVGSATLAVGLGLVVGVVAGARGHLTDMLLMRLVDIVLALPRLPLLVLIAALGGVGRMNLILIIGLLSWPEIARVVRAQTLALRDRGFITSAQAFGGGFPYVVRRHLLPALAPLLMAGFVAAAGQAVLMEAGLAFLGLADPTALSWGLMLNRALAFPGLYFSSLWVWWVLPVGFAIAITVLGFTFIGVGLEPALNPRWRSTQ